MDLLRNQASRPPFLDFEYVEEMGDKLVKEWTGLTVAQFNDLFLGVPSLIQEEKTHPKTALGIYLANSRTGETNERLTRDLRLSLTSPVRLLRD